MFFKSFLLKMVEEFMVGVKENVIENKAEDIKYALTNTN